MNTLIECLGWTLLHFLWQGAVVAAGLRAILLALHSGPASWRCAAAGAALLVMLAWSGVTGVRQWQMAALRTAAPPSAEAGAAIGALPGDGSSAAEPGAHAQEIASSGGGAAAAADRLAAAAAAEPTLLFRVGQALRPWLPWIVALWTAGVAALSIRFLRGWLALRQLRSGARAPVDPAAAAAFAGLLNKMRVGGAVALLATVEAVVPMVVGWLRPAVIVPASLFARLPAWQFEAILAHELAHIRRHDYLVNLLQNVVETLFFYHPAVWWVSAQLRKEREHCCDDAAASVCGDALGYAKALTALEEMRGFAPAGAVSASGGVLLERVRRMLGVPARPAGAALAWPAGMAVAFLVGGLLVGAHLVQPRAGAAAAAAAPEIRGLSLAGFPKVEDITSIADLYEPDPDDPRGFRRKAGVFTMNLGEIDAGPWLYRAANSGEFYLATRPDPNTVEDVIYGPIAGDPVERLDLGGWLRDSAAAPDPGYARRVARDMIAGGDTSLARLAFAWLGELDPPSPPHEHDSLIAAVEQHLAANPEAAAAEEARGVLAKLQEMRESARERWEGLRAALPDDRYSTGEPITAETPPIVWGEPAENGLRLGVAGVPAGAAWVMGSAISFDIYVRNDGSEPVRFAWTPRIDDGLSATLVGPDGEHWQASIPRNTILLSHNRSRLDPGHYLKLKSDATFAIIQANEDGTAPDPGGGGNRFLVDGPGEYQLQIRCALGIPDWTDRDGNEHPRPAGEWAGTLDAKPVEVILVADPGAAARPADARHKESSAVLELRGS